MNARCLVALAMWVAVAPLYAADPVIDGVQMPAWIERGGVRMPAAPGVSLKTQDRLVTGQNARLLLRMPEGSLVKLGENGTLSLNALSASGRGTEQLVNATLEVFKGAFRFTTQALSGYRGRRAVDIKVATVTAGIRGTDVWGKSDDARDLVCLIEGKVAVTHGADQPVTLDSPLDFYVAPKVGAPQKAKVDQRQLNQWALETEIAPAQGAARRGGRWKVYAASADSQSDALGVYDRLRNAGYAATIATRKTDSGISYRVVIGQLPSEQEARALAERLKTQLGVAEPTVSR